MLDYNKIKQIKERLNKATPDGWDISVHSHPTKGCRCLSCYDDAIGFYVTNSASIVCDDGDGYANEDYLMPYEDADFIIHARDDMLTLLEEIRHLHSLLDSSAGYLL